ncbi:MAG: glycosyltransferase [Okeania sp. SIO3I5]|uniref:glycosyltransferase n=1 Tax=Okeania sp. SIO3I5 TaxID=2607805 RepID=UPI0013B881A5|nr:glycosyltransferase [Okeania sp. SIO3I5]NEQ41001.1 glycosyltransferase [Okeania sp. SIO3I5]
MSKNRPDVAIYLRLLYGGGVERIMVNLMQAFVERGLSVDLVMNTVAGPYLSQVPPEVRIVDLKAPRMLLGLPKLAGYLRRERPIALLSGLHYNNEIALWAKALAFSSTRVVVSERNTLSVHANNRSTDRWSPLLAKLFYPWADSIVAISQGVAQDLVEVTGLPRERFQVIYNPVDIRQLEKKVQQTLEHPWFQSAELPVILGVGRLEKQKDFPTLIKAFAQVRQVQSARLVILGSGQERKQLNSLVNELGVKQDVAFLGFVENPYVYMARSGVFVLSSAWEGFGNVLLEAMALGTPVISTNCPNGPKEILDNGKYGELVPVGDSQAMAEAILRVLSGEVKSVDSDWLEQFKLETVAQKYLDVLGIENVRVEND